MCHCILMLRLISKIGFYGTVEMDHYFNLVCETSLSLTHTQPLNQNNGYLCTFLFSQIEFVLSLWHANAHSLVNCLHFCK